MLGFCITTHNSWVSGVDFLQEICQEMAHFAKLSSQPQQKDINILYAESGHPLEVIIQGTDKAMGLNLKGMFKPCKDCALRKAKKSGK